MLTGDAEIVAPLYGGPAMMPSANERILLSFKGLTDETEVLVDRDVCLRTMIGRAACLEGWYGKGRVVCISTHLEHPDYPEANDYFSLLLSSFPPGENGRTTRHERSADIERTRRTLANIRVLASALDSCSWKIGIKYWESDKLLFFADAVRKRIGRGEKHLAGIPSEAQSCFEDAERDLKALQGGGGEEQALGSAIGNLSRGASIFLNEHFLRLNENLP